MPGKTYSICKFIWDDEKDQLDFLKVDYENDKAVKSYVFSNLTLLNYESSDELEKKNVSNEQIIEQQVTFSINEWSNNI